MQFIQVQNPGPEGSMSHPITVISITHEELTRLLLVGVIYGVQMTGDALILTTTDNEDQLMDTMQGAVEKVKGPVDVFKTGEMD